MNTPQVAQRSMQGFAIDDQAVPTARHHPQPAIAEGGMLLDQRAHTPGQRHIHAAPPGVPPAPAKARRRGRLHDRALEHRDRALAGVDLHLDAVGQDTLAQDARAGFSCMTMRSRL